MSERLRKKIAAHKANVAVVGLGYVGLPLALNFAKVGFNVFGLDKDHDRVQKLQHKKSFILDVSDREIENAIRKGKFHPSTDFHTMRQADVIVICVPTPIKRKYTPDISYILSAVRTIKEYIKKDTLVILESTTYPGTTEELIKPELEKSGLVAERDFFLSFSPERIDPGNKNYDVTRIPKVVGGLSETSGKLAKLFYGQIIKNVHMVSSAEAAEMTKLLENSFRIINIGWINEVAMLCHKLGINVWEVIEAAKTKPFGFMPFYPGLGVGGHCIPEDPLYLYWKAKLHGFNSRFIKLSADTNAQMPQYVVGRLSDILKKKKESLKSAKLLVVGVTYKKDVKDLRKSPPLKLIELLQHAKARVDYFDPHIPYLRINDIHLKAAPLNKKTITGADGVIIATDHTKVNYKLILRHARFIFDTRNVYRGVKNNKVIRL